MSILICPECGAENPLEAENCAMCQASLAGVEPIHLTESLDNGQDDRDLLPQADADLPSLLESLKGDDDLSDFSAHEGEGQPSLPLDIEALEGEGEGEPEPDVPEWLNRIRQRAQTESDSMGEITQKITAAKDSLGDDKEESQRSEFNSLIKKIQEVDDQSDNDHAKAEESNESGQPEVTDADWLRRIRDKYHLSPDTDSQESLNERTGDSLLQWLVSLEEGGNQIAEAADPSKTSELPEDTHEVDISPAVSETTQEIALESKRPSKQKAPELSVSREEQVGADQLAAIIIDEKAPRPARTPDTGFRPHNIRFLMGLLLTVILSMALFLRTPSDSLRGTQQPNSLALMNWAESLSAESNLLLVLDYQAGYSVEIELLAKPILMTIAEGTREVSILYTSPSGGLLFHRLLDKAGLTEGLGVIDLGYYPMESYGAYGFANQASSKWQLRNQPEFSKNIPTDPFGGILILADAYEGGVTWIEQFSTLAPDTPIYVLVTAQAGPQLTPYWESGQIRGLASGMPDAVGFDNQVVTLPSHWRAYQAGVIVMIIVLTISLLFPIQQPQQHQWGKR